MRFIGSRTHRHRFVPMSTMLSEVSVLRHRSILVRGVFNQCDDRGGTTRSSVMYSKLRWVGKISGNPPFVALETRITFIHCQLFPLSSHCPSSAQSKCQCRNIAQAHSQSWTSTRPSTPRRYGLLCRPHHYAVGAGHATGLFGVLGFSADGASREGILILRSTLEIFSCVRFKHELAKNRISLSP